MTRTEEYKYKSSIIGLKFDIIIYIKGRISRKYGYLFSHLLIIR